MSMNKYSSLALICAVIVPLLTTGCGKDKESEEQETGSMKKEAAERIEFKAPENGKITREKLSVWLTCNPKLDSLGRVYAEKFKDNDPSEVKKLEKEFLKAQDRICTSKGLPGGYDEYLWIYRNLGSSKNRKLAKEFDIQYFDSSKETAE